MLVFVSAAVAAAPLSLQPPHLPHPPGPRAQWGLRPWGLGGMGLELGCSCPSVLQDVRQQLNSDHRGKMETLDIDRGCLSLNLKSPNISLKINPTRVPDG